MFEWEGDTVRMVTTDGHRLSKVDVKVGSTGMEELKGLPDNLFGWAAAFAALAALIARLMAERMAIPVTIPGRASGNISMKEMASLPKNSKR